MYNITYSHIACKCQRAYYWYKAFARMSESPLFCRIVIMDRYKDNSPALFSRWTENRFFWILAGLCAALYFVFLGSRALWDPGESRYADLSREMLDTGNWLVPHLNYSLYFEKPPLGYWLNALAMRVFGINEFGVRFTTALAGFAGVLGTYFWTEKVFNRRTALLSAGILMTSAGYFAWSQIPELDMLFSLFMCAGLGLFYLAFELKQRPALFMHLGYALLGAACLVKGIVGWAFPFVIVVSYLVLTRQWRRWKEFYPASGIALSFLVAGWWFVVIDRLEPDFFNFFFVGEHLQRFATTKHSRTGRIWYFIPVVLGMLFPWTAALVPAAKRLIKEGCFKLTSPAARPFIYMLLWAGSLFAVFSISSSKRPPYMVPLLPPVAVMLGWWFDRVWNEREGVFGWFAVPYAVLAGLISIALFAAPHFAKDLIDPRYMPNVLVPAFAMGLSAVLVWFYAKRGNTPELYRAAFITAILFLGGAYAQTHKLDDMLCRKTMARRIMSEYRPGEKIVSFDAFWERNMQSLTFYTGKRVLVNGSQGELTFGAAHDPYARETFPPVEDVYDMLKGDARVYVVLRPDRLKELMSAAGKPLYIAPNLPNKLILLSNKPWRVEK